MTDINAAGLTNSDMEKLSELVKIYGANNVIEFSKKVLEMEKLDSEYQFTPTFPRVKFVSENSITDQVEHILSEAKEVEEELFNRHELDKLDEEIADLQHSCETYFRIRAEHGADVRKIYLRVINKNIVRNYYTP